MFPHPMSRLEPSAGGSDPPPGSDLTCILEQHVAAGFPPDLALDLVLNELVVRAADATHASAAALALVRGDEMLCRAATGPQAPDLGLRFDTRGGLSGACIRTREPQLSNDTDADPRVEAAISRRLGIRSMLIVPLFDEAPVTAAGPLPEEGKPPISGLLEVFSPLPNAFNESAQPLLEEFARQCVRIRRAAVQLPQHGAAAEFRPPDAQLARDPELLAPSADLSSPRASPYDSPSATPRTGQAYEGWTLALAAVVIVAVVVVSFMIGTRIGWLRAPESAPGIRPAAPISANSATPTSAPSSPALSSNTVPPRTSAATKPATKSATNRPARSADELVVYEKGKVVFRARPMPAGSAVSDEAAASIPAAPSAQGGAAQSAAPGRTAVQPQGASPVLPAPATPRTASPRAVWLAPAQAERRLLTRAEPQYPAEALASHRSGDVVLEVHVAEDGTISAVRTLSGDPLLAAAAADAVRHWRYQPYTVQGHPTEFQTDVTLKFSLPE